MKLAPNKDKKIKTEEWFASGCVIGVDHIARIGEPFCFYP
jgi:hypothetical protein